RSTELDRALEQIALDSALDKVALGPLSSEDAQALAQHLVGERDGAAVALADEAGRHPLYMAELARHAHPLDRGRPSLDAALTTRIVERGAAPAALLEVLALAGGPLAQPVLARAAGLDGDELVRNLARLRSAHLLRAADDGIETYHDRVRTAVLLRLD